MNHPQEKFMEEAIKEAQGSVSLGQYAIGAIVVNRYGEIIVVDHTTLHEHNDPTCHAEVNAIRSACIKLNSRYLTDCWLYTTLEPCPMCTSAAIWAKMAGIVFGASKEDAQDFGKGLENKKTTWRQINISSRTIIEKGDPKIELVEKFMQEECKKLFDFVRND
ncbi:MAG: nucleoside deaminase [Candidatus Nomurabacteria bacterium]